MNRFGLVLAASLVGLLAAWPVLAQPVRTFEAERTRLMAAGYQPFKFLRWDPGLCNDGFCERHPEIWSCSKSQCEFVFERHSDHDFLVVVTASDRQRVLRVRPPLARIERPQFIKRSSPLYKDKKAELIAQGYRPVRLLPSDMAPGYHMSRAYPEALSCTADAYYCSMAFVQVSTGRYMVITTDGEHDGLLAAVGELTPADRSEVEQIKSRLPRSRR